MLTAEHLAKSLGGRQIIEDVTLSIARGEAVGMLGRNGAGKSTTFRMLTGMVTPDSGRILIDGCDITRLPFYERTRRGIGYLPQESFVPRSLSVEDNILLALEARERSPRKQKEILDRLIADFDLGEVRTKRVATLSGGQRRRCEIAAVVACEPRFAFFDEPFAGVDPHAVEELGRIIRLLTGQGVAVLITDHNARELLQLVDRVYVIEAGRVLAQGSAEAVVADEEVRHAYLGEAFAI